MTPRQIARFFQELARRVDRPMEVVLTGGAAAAVEGGVRPTVDVDFEARARAGRTRWPQRDQLAGAIASAGRATGITAHYSEDIDRWSAITMGQYRARARLWRRFGTVTVRVMDPLDFAVGKLARATGDDLRDIVAVFQRRRPSWRTAARRWGEALRRSPRSSAVTLFARQVEWFFRVEGARLWRRGFDAASAIRLFRRAAGAVDSAPGHARQSRLKKMEGFATMETST